MKEAFLDTGRLSGKVLMLIENANAIMAEYAALGFVMTLRMLHYQFVARQLFKNTYKNYKKLGWAMSQGRLMGLVDWDYLEDQVRQLDELPTWDDPVSIMSDVPKWYKEDLWADQEYAPEVHVEKGALLAVIGPTCREFRVPTFACRGYVSQSAQYGASKRFLNMIEDGKQPIVFHLGDHDPSGLDMTRDNRETFELLTGEEIEVRRLALNMDQIDRYGPPPNFAKTTDSRSPKYIREFGRHSWELDALAPNVLAGIIREAIEPLINQTKWKKAVKTETKNRAKLQLITDNTELVIRRLERATERGLL